MILLFAFFFGGASDEIVIRWRWDEIREGEEMNDESNPGRQISLAVCCRSSRFKSPIVARTDGPCRNLGRTELIFVTWNRCRRSAHAHATGRQ